MADLSVTIGGDSSDLDREIRDVEKQLQTLERRREARVRIGADVGDLDRRINQTTGNLTRLRNSLNQTANATTNLTRQTANGNNALTQFNRIVQDAPFGAMGVQNNLTAFGEAFGHLVTQTGSARMAFGALIGSLTGTGGVMLALSAVTSAMTYMSQRGLSVGDVMNMLTGDFNEARHAMQLLNVEATKNAQGDISGMNAYVSVAKDVNLSMEDRLIAVKKLQDEYPAYFGNLTKEQILNGQVASTVKQVTAALIARAKATALTERIVKLATEEEEIRNKINNQILEAARASKLTVAQTAVLAGNFKALAQNGGNFMDTVNKVGKEANIPWLVLNGTIVRVLQGFTDLGAELRNNKAQQDRLTGSLEEQTAAQIKLEAVKEKASKKTYSTPQVQGLGDSGLGGFGIIEDAQVLKQTAEGVYELENNIKTSLSRIPGYFDTSGQQALLSLQKFNEDMSKIIQGGIVDTLAGLGNAIGSALATGSNVLEAVGKTLLSSLGNVLTELGKMAIQTGIGILAIQTALKTLNPYVAIAAGVALVALGGAVTSSVQGLGSSGGGSGSYSSGRDYKSPVSSSSFGSSSAGGGGGTVVFEIDGQKLVGVLSNTLDKNSRLGGNLGLNS